TPDRLDGVADELEARRLGIGGGKHVEHTASARELAGLVDRIRRREARFGQSGRELGRIDLRPWMKIERGAQHQLWRTDARQERSRGRYYDACGARCQRVQYAGTRRDDVEVRGHAA